MENFKNEIKLMFPFIVPPSDLDKKGPAFNTALLGGSILASSCPIPPHGMERTQGQGDMCTQSPCNLFCPNEPSAHFPRVSHTTVCKWERDHGGLARVTTKLCTRPFSVQNGTDMGKQGERLAFPATMFWHRTLRR